jgi:hypothetical protein
MTVLEAINRLNNNEVLIKDLPPYLLRNWEVMLHAIKLESNAFLDADERLRNNKKFVFASLAYSTDILRFLMPEQRDNPEVIVEAIRIGGFFSKTKDRSINSVLQHMSDIIRADKNFVLPAVEKNGLDLQYASQNMQEDTDVVLSAVNQNGNALEFADNKFKSNRAIVDKAVSAERFYDNRALKFASDTLKADKEVVLHAVRNNGLALEFASETLRGDKEVVKAAFVSTGLSLQFADITLRKDEQFFIHLFSNSDSFHKADEGFQFFDDSIRFNRNLLMHAMQETESAKPIQYTSNELKKDREIIEDGICFNYSSLSFASRGFTDDEDIMLDAVNCYAENLEYASDRLKNDTEIVSAAVDEDGDCIRFASEELRSNRSLLEKAMKTGRMAYSYATAALKNDREFTLKAIKKDCADLADMPDFFKDDAEIVLAAIKNNFEQLQFASDRLKSDRKIVMAAVKKSPSALAFASNDLKQNPKFVLPIIAKQPHISSHDLENSGSKLPKSLLYYLPEAITGNKEFVLSMIEQYSPALRYVSADLKTDKDIVRKAFTIAPSDVKEKMIQEYYLYIDAQFYADFAFLNELGIQTVQTRKLQEDQNISSILDSSSAYFTFSNGEKIRYSSADGSKLVIAKVYSFSPYKGETLQDALDSMGLTGNKLKLLNQDKLDDVCGDFGDDGFKKEYKREMGMSGGPMAAAIANLWHKECGSGADCFENGVVVSEGWTYYDCIAIDPDYAAENELEFGLNINYIHNLAEEKPTFTQYLQPILTEMQHPHKEIFFILKYKFANQ